MTDSLPPHAPIPPRKGSASRPASSKPSLPAPRETDLVSSSREDAWREERARQQIVKDRTAALFMHMSILCGVPLFLMALFFQRDRIFVLHHAKAAGASFSLFYLTLLAGLLLWTPLFWMSIIFYVPSLVGVWHAMKQERAGLWGFGHLGEALFFPFQPNPGVERLLDYEERSEDHTSARALTHYQGDHETTGQG